ncbi:putative UPF0481 protein [Tanacetum coccineum]
MTVPSPLLILFSNSESDSAIVNVGDVDLGIPEINQPDVTTRNPSHSDEASTTTLIIDRITDVMDKSDDETIGFLLDCAIRGQNRGNQRPPSICKVSRVLRDLSESSFNPQLVSIGPLHKEDPKLQEFEWMKECYLDDLLKCCNNINSTPEKTLLEACLQKVNTLIPKIRESYAGVKKNYSDDEVATMMVMDGCFILEFCFKHRNEYLYLPNKMQNLHIAMDLMLLENQVPFFVLQALFDCTMGKAPFTLSKVLDESANHESVYRSIIKVCRTKRINIENAAFHSIVELDRSGMNFKPHQEGGWSMTIKFQSSLFAYLPWFWSKPTLLMPTLVIHDFTELILRNFIAYEQSFPQDRSYFTSYAHAMDMLINTQEDVAKLVESKVFVNILGSNQEAADMINKICKNMIVKEFYYTDEFKEMDKYYNALWPKHIARLRRVYFNNQWSAIALLAAIILFTLAVVQTIYAIKGK